MKKVIVHIANMAQAHRACRERSESPQGGHAERWANLHNAALSELIKDTLPHGSGFDSGVSVDWEATDVLAERYVFVCPFHVMNEVGFYVGWAEFRVSVTPSFQDTISLEIERTATTGDDAEHGLEDYVAEAMYAALTEDYELPSHYYADC